MAGSDRLGDPGHERRRNTRRGAGIVLALLPAVVALASAAALVDWQAIETPPERERGEAQDPPEDVAVRVYALREQLTSPDGDVRAAAGEELRTIILRIEEELSTSVGTPDADESRTIGAYILASHALTLRGQRQFLPQGVDHVEQCRRAWELGKRLDNHTLQSFAARTLGDALEAEGLRAQATEVFEHAVEHYGTTRTAVAIQVLLSQWKSAEGDWGESRRIAWDAWERVDRFLSESPDRHALRGTIAGRLAQIEMSLGRHEQAALHVEREQELAEASGHPTVVAGSLIHRARYYLATNRQMRLVPFVTGALESERLTPSVRAELELLLGTAYVSLSREDPSKVPLARETLHGVIDSADTSAEKRLAARARLLDLELRAGDLVRARAELETIRSAIAPSGGAELLRSLVASHESWLRLAELEEGQAPPPEHLDELLAEYGALLERWAAAPRPGGGIGLLHFAGRFSLVSEVIQRTLATIEGERGVERALAELCRAQALGSIVWSRSPRVQEAASYPVARLRGLLAGERSGVLVLFPAAERSHLFVLTADNVRHHELPRASILYGLRRDYVAALSSAPAAGEDQTTSAELERASAALARELFPPEVRAQLRRWSDVTLVGADLLGYLPIEFLPLDGSDHLRAGIAVSYLSSLPLGLLLLERPDPLESSYDLDLVALAATKPWGDAALLWDLDDLAFGPEQEHDLAGAYREDRRLLYAGAAAKREKLDDPRTRSARVFQILGHGVADDTRVRSAGVALADGVVWCDDIERGSRSPLVLVTACSAARGPLRRGEDGGAHLGGSFLAAGARVVVISPMDLEYKSVLLFSRVFHGELSKGATPGEAARAARAALRDDPARSHPYFSTIHVVGLGNAPVFRRQ